MLENFGSAFIEDVVMRQGLDPMEIDGFVPRGRYLYENFVMAHTTHKVRQNYAYSPRDPALFNFRNKGDFKVDSPEFIRAFGDGTFESVED